jgi:hypothetical protein
MTRAGVKVERCRVEAIDTKSRDIARLEISTMVRSWTNTNPATQGIVSVQLRLVEGELRVTIRGAAQGAPFNWGEVAVEAIYAENPSSQRGMAFVARYHFGFLDTLIEGNVNAGLLVLAAFHTFRDGSHRTNYFSREFFHEVAP